MRYLFLVLVLAMAGCLPAKVDVYPALQANVTPNPYLTNMTHVPVYVPSVSPEAQNNTIYNPNPPSTPNPYLNQTFYKSMDSYFTPMRPSAPSTYWMPTVNWYPTPSTPSTPVVFWTGSATVTVE